MEPAKCRFQLVSTTTGGQFFHTSVAKAIKPELLQVCHRRYNGRNRGHAGELILSQINPPKRMVVNKVVQRVPRDLACE